jgi:transcriptional regulator with XRE-family HTH domain
MEELASKTGVTPEYISMLEAGLRKPSYSVITELARAFGLTVGSFMSGVS